MAKISSASFYSEYHGHKVQHLQVLYPRLREASEALLWTAGDSSLDNKYWFNERRSAVGAYAEVLDPPLSVCDVTYWLNALARERGAAGGGGATTAYAAINAAVEATTLNERGVRLRPQDRFLRDHISPEDVLIVSVGGNDIALRPTPCTIASMAGLLCLPTACLAAGRSYGAVPVSVNLMFRLQSFTPFSHARL